MEKNVYLKTKSHHLTASGRLFIRLLCIHGMPEETICRVARVRAWTVHAITTACSIKPATSWQHQRALLRRAARFFEAETGCRLTDLMVQRLWGQADLYVRDVQDELNEKGQAVVDKACASASELRAQAGSINTLSRDAFAAMQYVMIGTTSGRKRSASARTVDRDRANVDQPGAQAVTASLAGSWGRPELELLMASIR